MTVKLALLKSGEDIIADIKEIVANEKVVGYVFEKPCIANMIQEIENEEKSYRIKLSPWIPLSKTEHIPVTAEWVITIVDPVDSLENLYKSEVLKNDQTNSIDEQSDSDIED